MLSKKPTKLINLNIMDLNQNLQNYGLTDKQAKVYLACLSTESGSVQTISKIANIPRTTCYEILDDLKQKGFVATFFKKKVVHFSAEDPSTLISQAKQKAELLENSLPAFLALKNNGTQKPSVRFYEGFHNLNVVWQEILREAKYFQAFSSADDLVTTLGEDYQSFLKKRLIKKVQAKIIMRESPAAILMKSKDELELRESKLTPQSYFHHSVVMMWNKKVALVNIGKDFNLLIIESEDISLFFKNTFNFIWALLP